MGYVEYVMKDGKTRMFMVTGAKDGRVSGVLFFDGSNDRGNFPEGVLVNVDHQQVAWIANVKNDESLTPKPGTYHKAK